MRGAQSIWNSLSPALQQAITSTFGAGAALQLNDRTYYSRVRMLPDTIHNDGSNNITYTFNAGHKVVAFQYGQGDGMTAAGYTDGRTGTYADTNLQTRGETNGGVFIGEAIGLSLTPRSEPFMAHEVLEDCYVTAGFGDNTEKFKLGPALKMPGGGTLSGGGWTQALMPSVNDAQTPIFGFAPSIGWPVDGNVREKGDPIVWYPKSAKTPDILFTLNLYVARAVSYTASARTAASGIVGVTPPSTANADGTFFDLIVELRGAEAIPRSPSS